MSDIRAAAARDYHLRAGESDSQADRSRLQRDRLVRQLRAEDPKHWTYRRLSIAVGCSPELIAHIVRTEEKTS
jgi:hypothetical protein